MHPSTRCLHCAHQVAFHCCLEIGRGRSRWPARLRAQTELYWLLMAAFHRGMVLYSSSPLLNMPETLQPYGLLSWRCKDEAAPEQ